MRKAIHICENCWFWMNDRCLNCDSPGDIRDKRRNDVCDGGGLGAEGYGFKPKNSTLEERLAGKGEMAYEE